MLALIDGDILVYRCGFAAEKTQYTVIDPEVGIPLFQTTSAKERDAFLSTLENPEQMEVERERLVEPLSHALANVRSVLSTIDKRVSADETLIFLSSGACFRNGIATIKEYKANRKDAPKPVHYDDIWSYLIEQHGALVYGSVEADDCLALMQTDDSVVVSIDKDLLQIPGKHYHWVRDRKVYVSPEVALQRQYMQVLTGDPTDNIPGIRGVGEVTARKILKDVELTKKALSEVCTRKWDEYLRSDLEKPVEINSYEHPTLGTMWTYSPWYDPEAVLEVSSQDVAMEVFQLVTVGGMHAKNALADAGEALPET